MPKITDLVFALPVDVVMTIDKDGAHLWTGAKGMEPAHALHVRYDPVYLTGDYLTALAEAQSTQGRYGAIVQFLAIVKQWDMTDGESTVIPLEEEPLGAVPLPLLNTIVQGCLDDAAGPKADSGLKS